MPPWNCGEIVGPSSLTRSIPEREVDLLQERAAALETADVRDDFGNELRDGRPPRDVRHHRDLALATDLATPMDLSAGLDFAAEPDLAGRDGRQPLA